MRRRSTARSQPAPAHLRARVASTVLLAAGALCVPASPAVSQGFFRTVVEFVANAASPQPQEAGGPVEVPVRAEQPNVETQGPEALDFTSGPTPSPDDDRLILLDPVRMRVLLLRRDGEVVKTVDLANSARPLDVEVVRQAIYVLDGLLNEITIYDEDGSLLERIGPLSVDLGGSASLTVGGEDDFRISIGGREFRFGRTAPRGPAPDGLVGATVATSRGLVETTPARASDTSMRLGLTSGDGTMARGGPSALTIDAEDFLADARLVGRDAEGRFYVLVDTLGEADEADVRTELRRYDAEGNLLGAAVVPLDRATHVPRDAVALADDGEAFALIPEVDVVRIVSLEFSRPGVAPRGAVEPATEYEPPQLPEAFERAVMEQHADQAVPRGTPFTTRADILRRAEAYLVQPWTLGRANYEPPDGSVCDPQSGRSWSRPPVLDDRVEQTIVGLPYDWGGYVSLDGFLDRIDEGQLAGDVCTCRSSALNWCLTPNSTGVDCSGFVSQALGVSYHTTSRLHEITDRLPSFLELQPGDIVNRSGNHVRLVTGIDLEGGLTVETIESAVSCGGMCRSSYGVSELRKYEPRRYKFLTE